MNGLIVNNVGGKTLFNMLFSSTLQQLVHFCYVFQAHPNITNLKLLTSLISKINCAINCVKIKP